MTPLSAASTVRAVPQMDTVVERRAWRRPVAVIVSRFPLVTETFILREIEEFERQGQPVVLVPLIRQRGGVVHHEAASWVDRMLYVPFVSLEVVRANLRLLWRRPRAYVAALAEALAGSARSVNVLIRTLALFPKTACLASKLAELGVEHVHAHFATYPAGAALAIARLGGPSFSFTAHAHDIFVPWRQASLRRKVEEARFVRAIAGRGREHLLSICGDALASKIDVIHVGVRLSDYTEHAAAPPNETPTLVCVAALKAYKGLAVLLEACQRLESAGLRFHCEIVGDGPLRGRIERLRASMRLRDCVTLRGALRQDDVRALLARADIAVAPSIVAPDGQMDGIPVALMEAMASAKPVVASRLSGVPELVDNGVTGLLCEPGNAAELAEAIEQLLADPALGRRMGRRGREKVAREFTLDRSVTSLLERIDAHNPGVAPGPDATWPDALGALLPGQAVGVRRVHERPDSTVLEVLASDGACARELVLKVHASPRGDARAAEARARHEFAVLRGLAGMGDVDPAGPAVSHGVPEALGRSGAALLLAACEGRLLVDLARDARLGGSRRRRLAIDAVQQAGRWLRTFQRHTRTGDDAGPILEVLVEQARRDLDLCVAARFVSVAQRAVLRHRLDELAGALGAGAVAGLPVVGHHGDFWPGNIFVSADRIAVIDFEGYRQGLPLEDPAYFLVQLELFFAYGPLVPFGRRLGEGFLRAYGDAAQIDGPAYAFCRLAKALQVLASDGRSQADPRVVPGRRRRRALLRMALQA